MRASRPGRGSDYRYVDPRTGLPVYARSSKRRREGMYPVDAPYPVPRGRTSYAPATTRTFRDVQQGRADFCPIYMRLVILILPVLWKSSAVTPEVSVETDDVPSPPGGSMGIWLSLHDSRRRPRRLIRQTSRIFHGEVGLWSGTYGIIPRCRRTAGLRTRSTRKV